MGTSREDETPTAGKPSSADGTISEPIGDAESSPSDRLSELRFSTLPSIDDWELDEQLKHVERLLAAFRPPSARHSLASSLDENAASDLRIDAPIEKSSQANAPPAQAERPWTIGAFCVWLMVTVSWTALACGGALSGWGWYIHRDDFWNLGLPILFGGQLGLLMGLMLQLLLTVRHSPSKESTKAAGQNPIPPASHTTSVGVDQRLARMQRQIDGFTQRFDPTGR